MGRELHVISDNPYQQLTVKKRIRQLLHTHQGRDKLFKVAQYLLRIKLWLAGVHVNPIFTAQAGSSFTADERNLMTIINSRRMFRVGRFVGEFVRLRVTLIKVSEILQAPSSSTFTALFLQTQMLLDIIARVIMFAKSVMEDVAYMAQKGFLRSNVGERLVGLTIKLSIPVLIVDLFLNSLRLLQGVQDAGNISQGLLAEACTSRGALDDEQPLNKTFSLLSKYNAVDKLRRRSGAASPQPSLPNSTSRSDLFLSTSASRNDIADLEAPNQIPSTPPPSGRSDHVRTTPFASVTEDALTAPERIEVSSYAMLFWADFELHWVFVTQMKLLLDIFVATSLAQNWTTWRGPVSWAGLASGLLSVYRVWTYGR